MIFELRDGRLGRCLGLVDGYLGVICLTVIGVLGDLGLERVRLTILKRILSGSFLPLILALQCFLGFLQLLDALGVVYYPLVHKATREVRFELGLSLMVPLLVLLVLWLGLGGLEAFEALLFPAVGFFVYPFLGFEASVSVVSLLAVVSGLWFHRSLEKFFAGVFMFLIGLEAPAFVSVDK